MNSRKRMMNWTAICQQVWWLRNSKIHPKTTDVRFGPYFLCGEWVDLPVVW